VTRVRYLLVGSLLVLSACGYVGDPEPPSLNIPVAVTDLRVVQRGSVLDVRFTLPDRSTDGLLLPRLNEVYLEASGAQIAVADFKPGKAMTVELPVASFAGKSTVFRLRVRSHKGNWSDWSNVMEVPVLARIDPPAGLSVTATALGVAIRWSGALEVRIRRKAVGETEARVVGAAKGGEWVDASAQFGAAYEYSAQSVDGASESAWSPVIAITPVDTFPPAAPKGLTVIVGVSSVELAWDLSTEADVAGYRVQRVLVGSDGYVVVGETTAGPSYSDRTVMSGRRYSYRVVAFDESGNVSGASDVVEAVVP